MYSLQVIDSYKLSCLFVTVFVVFRVKMTHKDLYIHINIYSCPYSGHEIHTRVEM